MNQPEQAQSTTTHGGAHGPCPCHEVVDAVRQFLGISPDVKQHLVNSRIEFLKALRAVLDARIEHLANATPKGTKVAVE
jgi:hypothetical protein